MKHLKDIMLEGLLKGQKDTLKNGDEYANVIEEFEEFKKLAGDLRNYEKHTGNQLVIKMHIPLLCKFCGIKNTAINTICFVLSRFGFGSTINKWQCDCYLLDTRTSIRPNRDLNFPNHGSLSATKESQFEYYIVPIIKDFNTFVNWLSNQIKLRKY